MITVIRDHDHISDSLLPRVVELAETARDRKTKIAACESLHTAVLITIARRHNLPSEHASTTLFSAVYQHVFHVLLRLAADSDDVVRALFAPLVLQIIRCLAGRFAHTQDISLMMDAVISALTTTDSATREYAARCIAEFLAWSIKNTGREQAAQDKRTTEPLIDRLLALARHPNPYQRLGAAVAFNAVYRIFREEDSLIDRFAIELSGALLHALRLADADDPAVGTVSALSDALDHSLRIMSRRVALLAHPNDIRRSEKSLNDFLISLLHQLSIPEEGARNAAMKLFSVLLPLAISGSAPHAWISKELHHSDISPKTLASEPVSIAVAKRWLLQLSASLHTQCFLVMSCNADPALIFNQYAPWNAVNAFLQQYSTITANDEQLAHTTPQETAHIVRAKCEVITGLLRTVELASARTVELASHVLNERFVNMVLLTTLEPWSLGFNIHDANIVREVCI